MEFFKRIKRNLIANGMANQYNKAGFAYSESEYEEVKRAIGVYIHHIETIIKTYNKRNEIEKDKSTGEKIIGNDGHLKKPYKEDIPVLFKEKDKLYSSMVYKINTYISIYSGNKKLKNQINKLKNIEGHLSNINKLVSYEDKTTTAKNPIKLSNSFRWKNKRNNLIKAVNKLKLEYKIL